ncbi:MAG TPA: DUF4292 domain-containing protein, partial [Chitinophagaceae bacterium]|nr:DUF4292 domain-containing protein [Chitinophagaceae bacterium]
MKSIFAISIIVIVFVACRPTKKIQTAINKKDSIASVQPDNKLTDSLRFIKDTYKGIIAHHINFTTFSAKINVDYVDADDKRYNVNANLRMYKDSLIWVSINAIFGIEALRAVITKDSIKI